nr:PREDICTED: tetratricopeptide repeat protein 17 isoform X1 [Tribolium castaneum]|eukprot:XP_008192506.1 PREDICTED: tetratricopeptide repeat protein 17 isoform X1 [Tribolium castaneum]
MVILRLWTIFFVFFKFVFKSNGATHWVVTEKGMIQSHVGSPLDLRRPYDLISLLDQEKRWNEVQTVLQELMTRKSTIEEKWSNLQGNPSMESKVALKNSDCLMNGKLLNAIDIYNIATNGSERVKVDLTIEKDDVTNYHVPDCSKYSKIEFSLPDYERFPSLHSDDNITLVPEDSLEKLMPVTSVRLFGHEIHKELVKNSSSWVHYNLGALFWRMKGNGPKAVDCSRRALHYVPTIYRDIPLHNLAGILHKAGRSKEATLMLHTALESASKQNLHYLALGNIYFAMGDYNNSLLFYDKFLELEPEHNEVNVMKQATLCFSKLETHLIDIQENVLGYLQSILSDLHDFHSLQQHWLRLSKRLMWEHSSYDEELGNFQDDVFDISNFGKKSQRCVKKMSTISCDLVDSPIADFDTMNLQNLFQYVESETQKINERMAKTSRLNTMKEGNNAPQNYPKFPTTMSTSGEKYFDVAGWPSEEECKKWDLPVSDKDDLKLPIFLPPENKGYDINKILSDSIGLPNGSEHKLPWYPPVCDESNAFGEKYVQQSERHLLNNEIKSNQFLRNHFVKYVNNGKADEAEIGQRIITAIEKKSAPSWILSTLASLYWRIRGNTRKSLDCLDLALKTAPKDQTDVILVSISSIVHQLGLVNQALKYANLAFKLNYVEPSTNFLLALLHYESNPLMAMYYMKNVLRVDPEYYDGQAELLLKIWGCRVKMGTYNNVKKPSEKLPQEICSEKESFKGQGMICSANGDDCKTASIQCFHTKNLEDGVKPGVRHSLISTILAEGSGDVEPDQSQLERISDSPHPFHMRILLGDDQVTPGPTPEFYVGFSDDSTSETVLHVYDKSGTYSLSSQGCKQIIEADWVHFTSMWQSIAARNLDIGPYLKPLPKNAKKRSTKPYCSDASFSEGDTLLVQFTNKILRSISTTSPDKSLAEWLGIMAGDQKASVEELGAKIGLALQENTTSWLLATAAAIYWRVVGNTEEAIVCLRLALNHVPDNMKDVPLINLANVLQRFGINDDALDVAYMALKSNPNFVVNHFTVGNILAAMGDLEEAISFHRSALALDSNFEPARNRLQAILCTLLFDESGTLRNIPEN